MQRVLDHGQYIMGTEVQELEERLQAYTGAKHCITVASGTEALLISLMALGIKPGDEVITTPFTFVATAEVIVLVGAVPVFVDIQPDNAPTESWFGSFKNERVYGERFETRDELIAMAFEYIEVFYNRKRLHSTSGFKPPMQFLHDWLNAQQQEKLVA